MKEVEGGNRKSSLGWRRAEIRREGPCGRSGISRTVFFSTEAFSLVEVVLAIGVISFALISIMALLTLGLKTNMISAEESRAANILTTAEADLRNSSTAGTSLMFKLPTPYQTNAVPPVVSFSTPEANTLFTKGLDNDEIPVAAAVGVRYQVSIIYTKVPAAGSLLPMEARLIVNWPCLSPAASSVQANLTDPSKVTGYIESYVTFAAP